ncbi:aldose 1-epimerase family protein [Bosea caraganae]|uniref:Aldose 1-epimerase family protein n=1 Tax=Bosea caraganae TaxID=2763117 RepID=A0A370KZM3_9HYPH|nr:aldose 1-epimerase family protein [Bosea caraganae]RDJ20441.1 aldose 1-epimerase family protein [Bosea caraganae]RDJ29956.1 aldose 1-epimerase family protein [Bosea caraganae]
MPTIANDDLTVQIAPLGAELQAITDKAGRNWLWHGDPAFWAGRSPLLFPVIGKHRNGEVLIDGKHYPIPPHGIARTSTFELVEQARESCVLRLSDTAGSRAAYPFAFTFDMAYRLEGMTLVLEARIENRGDRPMPFCFGHHPAFPWPLPGADGLPHQIHLDGPRAPKHLRIDGDGLLQPEVHASVFKDGVLTLDHAYFADDALIYAEGTGSSLWYGAKGHPGVRVDCPDMPHLGIWTKPGAPYICIEPWHGLPSAAAVEEPLDRRPGAITLAPGEATTLAMRLAFAAAGPA